MRRAALALLAAGLCALALAGLLLHRLDPDAARVALAQQLEAALALPVALGRAELTLFPLPALQIRELRIGSASGPQLEAPQLRAGLSLLALLRGVPTLGSVRLRVRDGTLEVGDLRLEQIEASGVLGAGTDSVFEFSAQSALLGRIEEGRLELGPAAPEGFGWNATGSLGDVELAALGEALELPGLRGHATGRLAAAGRGTGAERAALELESDLTLQGRQLEVAGRVKLAIDLAGQLALDLGAAKLRLAERFEKPAGVALRISGVLQPPRRALRAAALRIESDLLRATGQLDIRQELLVLDSGLLDLAQLTAWTAPDWVPRSGSVRLESARLAASEWPQAAAQLSQVGLPLGERAHAQLSGRMTNEGTRASADALRVELAGEEILVSGFYDWQERWVEAHVSARGALIAPLAEALWSRENVSGRLYGQLELIGPPELAQLAGFGEFDLRDGELPNLSLLRASGIDATDEELPGLDRFDSLAGSFELANRKLEIDELTVIQQYVTAVVSGQFYLQDMTADLTGVVRFDHPTLPEPSVRPILRMAGHVDGLETHISEAQTEDVKQMEARMIEAIRKVEAERRGETAAPEPPPAAERSG